MPRPPQRNLIRRDLIRPTSPHRLRQRGEEGFLLLETAVSIALITVLMGALATFFVHSVTISDEQRAREAATQLATTSMERLRALPPSDLVTGRDSTSVTAQVAAASASVQPALTAMTPAVDASAAAGSGATAQVPTRSTTQVLNDVTYGIDVYLGRCTVSGTTGASCTTSTTGVAYLRAVIAVTWRNRACAAGSCSYVTATLISQDGDPTFNTSQTPPTAPVVTDPGNQVSTVGAVVSLQLTVNPNTGVPPLTWQVTSGVLPTGLTLSSSGLISGTPSALAAATSVTVTVSDAFSRTATDTFTWRVVGPPTITTPAAQSSTVGQAVSLPVASTCPNGPCVYSLANGPAGLTIDPATGTISGSPTTAGTYAGVVVSAIDDDGVAASTAGFSWRVLPAPTIGTTGVQTATVGTVKSVAVAYTCPTTTCTLTLTGPVPGLGLSATTPNGTNNTTTNLTVSAGSGTVYIAGTVSASAVTSGTSTGYTPKIRITDGNGTAVLSAGGLWTIYAAPTVSAPGTRGMTVGSAENVAVTYTCPSTPCTLTLANAVPGLGLSIAAGATGSNSTTTLTLGYASGVVYINGTVSAAAVPSGTGKAYAVTVAISDAGGATTTAAGVWTAYVAPSIAYPGSQAVEPLQTLSLQTIAVCPDGGCSYVAEARLATDTSYFPITISSTGRITYANTPPGAYVVRVTVTDAEGVAAQTTFTVTVQTFTLAIPAQTTTKPTTGTKTVTLNVAALVGPTADGYVYTLSGQPSWLTIDANGLLTATLTPTSLTDTAITVTVTSSASSTSTVSSTFSWTLK